jgi:hypothetical protein
MGGEVRVCPSVESRVSWEIAMASEPASLQYGIDMVIPLRAPTS